MTIAGDRWHKLSEEEKEPYNKMHEEDIKRYEKELKELEEKGYFTLADGSRSVDIIQSSKKRKSQKDDKDKPSKKK